MIHDMSSQEVETMLGTTKPEKTLGQYLWMSVVDTVGGGRPDALTRHDLPVCAHACTVDGMSFFLRCSRPKPFATVEPTAAAPFSSSRKRKEKS